MAEETVEKGTHLHHPEAPSQPGKIPGEVEKGERRFATIDEFGKALEGAGTEAKKEAEELRRKLRAALLKGEREKAGEILEKADELVRKEPELKQWARLMEQEATGEVEPGKPSLEAREVGVGKPPEGPPPPEAPPAVERPEDIRRVSDEIDQEKDREGILLDPRTEKMKYIEGRYFLWVEEPRRTMGEVEDQYLRYLAGIGARQPTPGQGIAGREWEEIARYTGEIDSIIRKIERKPEKERTNDEIEELRRAQELKRFASAYYHELDYYHRFWYGEEAGIGKEVNRPKEGSRLLLTDQWAPLFTHSKYGEKVEKAFKEETSYKSDAELIDRPGDEYGFRRLGHHLRRYSLAPMFRDAYEEGIRIDKTAEKILYKEDGKEKEFPIRDPGFGKSFEYSLYSIYYGSSWAKETNPNWELLVERDVNDRPIRDHGELGATYDMWTTPARLGLYLLNWEHIGRRNQIRLTAGREWLEEHPKAFLPKEESEKLRDILWKDRDGEPLTDEEKAKMVVNYSNDEIMGFQAILQKIIRGERLTPSQKEKMDEFESVALRNLLNRDLGVDPNELNHGEIWRNSLSRHERITPNDVLTNILVDVRRMEQTIDDLASGSESFLSKLSFEKINAMKTERYAHLGDISWLVEREINYLREVVTEITLAGVMRDIRFSGSALFEEKRKQIYDTLKQYAGVGFHAAKLKELYGFDFTRSEIHERGAPLKDVINMLYRVHGERKIRAIYRGESRVMDVLNNREDAQEVNRVRFQSRFGFNNYTSFEVGIIEEPVLNAMGMTREALGAMTERERTRILWLAKKGLLPGNQGIFMRSRLQDWKTGWEQLGERRREGGEWIMGFVRNSPHPEELQIVGYVIKEEGKDVFYRTIAWEDPVQENLFDVEQMIYSRNAELISAHLANQSAEISENPNAWLTPPERRDLIDEHRMKLDIDDDRAIELMRIHGCRDADKLLWTAKSWVLTYALEPIARMFPGIKQVQIGRRIPANLAGAGTSAAIGLWTFGQWAAAGPLAAGPLSMVASAVALIPASWLLRRIARWRTIPGTQTSRIGFPFFQIRLPFFWLREGKEPTPLE